MRIFEARPNEEGEFVDGLFDATHQWSLPGVICPICGNTWSNTGLAYPLLSLTGLPFEKDYRLPRAVPLQEFDFLKNRLVPLLHAGTRLLPGTEFGPLVGKARGTFGDFAWLNPWTLLIKHKAYLQLQRKRIRLPSSASHNLVIREKVHDSIGELQVEPYASLQTGEASGGLPCGACGYTQLSLPDQIVVERSTLPEHVDLFRASDFTTLLFATEDFKNATNELGLTGIEFREVSVSPSLL